MNILVTGANGFVGSNLVYSLLAQGFNVFTVVRESKLKEHKNLTIIVIDLINIDSLCLKEEIEIVFHVAANISFDNSYESICQMTKDNLVSTFSLANFIIKHKIKKVVFSSTCSVYDSNSLSNSVINENSTLKPQNNYAVSKLSSEWILSSLLDQSCANLIILRYSSIYGFGQRPNTILPIFLKKAMNNELIQIFGSGNRKQDYVYIDNIVEANINCINLNLPSNSIFNVVSGDSYSDMDMASLIIKITNSFSKIEILNESNVYETFINYSVSKAISKNIYKPISLDKGLNLYFNNLRQFESFNNK